MRLFYLWLGMLLLCAGCGGPRTANPDELRMRVVVLPNGEQIRAEVKINPVDQLRGMMFRDSVPRGEGMLFIYPRPDKHPYWMYQTPIPLDIIWMDSRRRIVEISADTPPCTTKASECPHYGGHERTQFVLEIGAGEAKRYGLNIGQVLSF